MTRLRELAKTTASRRTATIALLSFSSGLPLGLVWYAIPDWMRSVGVEIQTVGLLSLAQLPWTFKLAWAPLIDRYAPPFWSGRRGWVALMQITLMIAGLVLARLGERPEALWVVGATVLAIAVASATQDIALDAYAVDLLDPGEQGAVVGARAACYRVAMIAAGGAAISAAARIGWPAVNVLLACAYLPLLLLTRSAPEPARDARRPTSLRAAVWQPLVEIVSRPRAVELLGLVLLYKLPDHLAQALVLPFLGDMGYTAQQRGVALASLSAAVTVAGTVLGGWLTTLMGLGTALWVGGLLQLISNLGYVWLANLDAPSVAVMLAATGFEQLTTGLGAGVFSVLLLRLTAKRYSATQYALLSSLFALPRALAGSLSGFAVASVGWSTFFLGTMVSGLPGLLMLARVVPLDREEEGRGTQSRYRCPGDTDSLEGREGSETSRC